MKKSKKALSYFNNSFNCAQSVFTTFGPELGLAEDDCLKIACAFGAGMGKQQHVCGAVSGALMVLGAKFGKALNDPESKKEITYSAAEEFLDRFKAKNGSIICKKLLRGLNMNDPEELKKINELKLFKTSCEKYIQDAVEIAEKLISTE
ncbi:MAG: C-GCAxxG-C-C family protein [Thiohalospira sp.]